MDIQTVKDLGEQYKVNDNIDIPKIVGNGDYQKVINWLAIEGNDLFPVHTVDELKEIKHQQRKQLRDKEKYAPTIDCLNSTYKSDIETLQALSLARGKLNGVSTTLDWYDANDVAVSLTTTQVKELITAIIARGFVATQKSKTIKAEINAITELSELESYDVKTRWNDL